MDIHINVEGEGADSLGIHGLGSVLEKLLEKPESTIGSSEIQALPSDPHHKTPFSDEPLRPSHAERRAQEQTQRDLTFWAHVLESAHDDETRSLALAGYQFAALELIFGRL